MQNDGQRAFGQNFLVADFHRHRQRICNDRSLPAARAETIGTANHHESDAQIANGIVHRLSLIGQQRIGSDIRKNYRVVWHQRERVQRKLQSTQHIHLPLALPQRGLQSLPFGRITLRIHDQQYSTRTVNVQIVADLIIFAAAVRLRRHFNLRGVLIIARLIHLDGNRIATLAGLKFNFLPSNRVFTFLQYQRALARRERTEHHRGFVGFAQLDEAWQIESFQQDLVLVVILNRDDIHLNTACLQIVDDVFQLTDRFCPIADKHNPAQMFLRQHRRAQRQRLLKICGILADLRVDVFLEWKRFSRRILHGCRSTKHDEPGLIGRWLLSGRCCHERHCIISSLIDGIGNVDVVNDRDDIAGSDGSRFCQNQNEQPANHQPDKCGPRSTFNRQARMSGRLHPPQPRRHNQKCKRPRASKLQFTHNFERGARHANETQQHPRFSRGRNDKGGQNRKADQCKQNGESHERNRRLPAHWPMRQRENLSEELSQPVHGVSSTRR